MSVLLHISVPYNGQYKFDTLSVNDMHWVSEKNMSLPLWW